MHITDDLAEGRTAAGRAPVALPALEVLGTWLTDDVGVPAREIAALIDGCERIAGGARPGHRRRRARRRRQHAPDDRLRPRRPDQRAARRAAFDDILGVGRASAARSPASTASARIKHDFLADEIGPVGLDVHRAIKDALDPAGLFNPGKVFRRAAVADLAAVGGLVAGS